MIRDQIYQEAFEYALERVERDEANAYARDCRQRFDDGEPPVVHAEYFPFWNSEDSWKD